MSSLPVSAPDLPHQCIEFKFSDIQRATNYFHKSSVIGNGEFSTVYKGSILVGENRDESVVAIKRLQERQGEREFLSEMSIQSKVRHRNLVSLIGYCKNEKQERIIVTEYMSKGTLEDRLHRREYPPLTLVRRLKILIGAACGLDHLHTGTGINHGVIHRDMKPENILLDDNLEPKICDFGLSKTGLTNQTSDNIRGTLCYVDPDYFETGIPTQKSDVSFGIIMLEVLCGRKPIDESFDDQNQWILIKWVQECYRMNTLAQIVDTNLVQGARAISTKCLDEFAQLAMWCLHDEADQRPTMADVVAGLETILATQENADIERIKSMKKKIFGSIKVPSHLIPFKREKNPDCSSAPSECNQRYKILQGVARVLLYLHSHAPVRVIHFDVKPGKIMLDESLNPKLFGFYFARSIAMTEADCIQIDAAHRIAGCLAPEYICTDRLLSTKCDVFNFGVLVLVTVTAERILEPSTADSLEINVRRKWWEGAYSNKAESEMTKRFIMVGLFCIQTDATQRPGMEEVVAMLMGTSDALLKAIKAMNRQEWEMGIKTTKSNSARSAEASTSASHPWCVGSSS